MSSVAAPVLLDVILRDGQTLRLRAPVAADRDALVAFLEELSPDSRQMRFHGTLRPGPRLSRATSTPDWNERGALIGTLVQDGREHVVALASYARLRDPAAAEVAFAVADRLQRLGVGTRLLEQLARRASAVGIERLVFEILSRNAGMLAVVADAGLPRHAPPPGRRDRGHDVDRADGRVRSRAATSAITWPWPHRCGTSSSRPSLAVIGASARRGTIGGELFRNVVAAGFAGPPIPSIAAARRSRASRPSTSVRGDRGRVDLAVICVPAEAVLAAADGRARGRRPRSLRDLRRVRRGRRGGRRAAGAAARARARPTAAA